VGISKDILVRNMICECQVWTSIHGEYRDQRGPVDRRLWDKVRLDPFTTLNGSTIGMLLCVSFTRCCVCDGGSYMLLYTTL
jgi:hypothetical protein